jgi:ParB family chromosome partitioning protein
MAKLTILKNPEQAKANNTTVRESFRVSPGTLTQRPPFQGLYQIDPGVLERITAHMRANGYDNGQPITVWRHELENGEEERVVVDGHTRLQAARDLGLLEVTVVYRSFSSTRAALEYAIHNQRDRRNLSDAEIVGLVEMVDRPVTGFKGDAPIATPGTIGEKPVRTADITAAAIGVGRGKVEEARTVLSDPEVKEKVKAGGISIHAGAQVVKAKKGGKSRKEVNARRLGKVPATVSEKHVPVSKVQKLLDKLPAIENAEEARGFAIASLRRMVADAAELPDRATSQRKAKAAKGGLR